MIDYSHIWQLCIALQVGGCLNRIINRLLSMAFEQWQVHQALGTVLGTHPEPAMGTT